MQGYKTVTEKAEEWNVTPRHVQYLCRAGKVQDAVKRAGSWFIPTQAPNPVKNTKASAGAFRFAGTKRRIFDGAIQLFVLKGFNEVSLRDIAGSVGIRQSTMYNHFSSKQQILDTIYDFYCHYYLLDRPSLQHMKNMLQSNSLMEIIESIRYDFKEEYRGKMSDISKIIFQRAAVDDRARTICKTLILEEGIQYVETIFDKGIKMGRFAPFDAHAMAVFINCVRLFTFFNWMVDPSQSNMAKALFDEETLYKCISSIIKDLQPCQTL